MIRPVHPIARVALAVLAGAVLATGCGTSSGGGADSGARQGGAPGGVPGEDGGAVPGQPHQGADGLLVVPAGVGEAEKQEYAYANSVAACMKKAGFTFAPYVSTPAPQDRDDFERDYEASRKSREKYGFGAFAGHVFPDDPNLPGKTSAGTPDPNAATFDALPTDRQATWNTALFGVADRQLVQKGDGLGGCMGEAQRTVYGTQAEADRKADVAAEQARINRQNLNGDAELVRLAQAYATCLRGKGYPVATTSVTQVRTALRFEWFAKAGQMTPHPPEGVKVEKRAMPRMDPALARTMLAQEVTAALADIDCGKDFRAAYFPKLDKAPGAEGVG
ncbi:hypothetical protein OG216_26820 [Streptomycetaceae bacterium NBC_01309]